jgi:hypothetical protein
MLSEFIKGVEKEEQENQKIIESGKGKTTHARWFGPSSLVWTDRMFDEEYCLMFLKYQERYANDILRVRGHLFLNEVYDMLGLAKTVTGQVVGWINSEDKWVDFGIYSKDNSEFINGGRAEVLLDFNVDGNILD